MCFGLKTTCFVLSLTTSSRCVSGRVLCGRAATGAVTAGLPALFPPLTCCVQVYSFGVTLWEIMERKRPFAGMDGFQIQTQVHSALDSVGSAPGR
jgi:hypothetical protein